jgi:hypothetical protein
VSQQQDSKHDIDLPDTTRRNFLAVGSAVLATVASAGVAAPAQEAQDMREAEKDISASDPGRKTGRSCRRTQLQYAAAHRPWRYCPDRVLL